MPENIRPAKGLDGIFAVFLMVVGGFLLLPVVATLFFDGVRRVTEWPAVLYGCAALGLLLVWGAQRVFARRTKTGAWVDFYREGFVIGIQPILGPLRIYDLKWADIEEMRLVEAPRGGDILAFRQSHGAAVRAGLIQPTTREDAAKVLVRREIALPLRLVSVGIDDAVARFHASADGAGAKLVAQSSFNVVVFVRKVWSVTWP